MKTHQNLSESQTAGKRRRNPERVQLQEYSPILQKDLFQFLRKCMPESGRTFDPLGRHKAITDISHSFLAFWCLTDGGEIIGCSAVKVLAPDACELKMMYVYNRYQGMGLGRRLLTHAIQFAADQGYQKILLDSTRESSSAISLYCKNGFYEIPRYNHNQYADIFMQKDLC